MNGKTAKKTRLAALLSIAAAFASPVFAASPDGWTFDPSQHCGEAMGLGSAPALRAIDPAPVIRRMLRDGQLRLTLAGTAPSPEPDAVRVATRTYLINTINGENTTARRMASGMPDIYVVELFSRGTDPPTMALTSSSTMAFDQPDTVGQGKIEFRNAADFSGIADLASGSLAAKGVATIQLARIAAGGQVTVVPLSQNQIYLAKSGDTLVGQISPGAGMGIEFPTRLGEPLRISAGAGPMLGWSTLSRDPKAAGLSAAAFMDIELLLF